MTCSIGCGLGPVGGVGLVEDIAYVVAHSLDANEEVFADLAVGLAPADQPKLFIDSVEIVAPYYASWPPQTRTAILFDSPAKANEKI